MKWVKKNKGNVTSPGGFLAAGMHCGIKKRSKKEDAGLVVSEVPAVAAATFTTNNIKAWPVLASIKAMKAAKHQAVLVSSGNANCVNGAGGKKAVDESLQAVAKELGVAKDSILIAQTGLIGAPFPITRFKRAIPQLVGALSKSGAKAAAKSIMTTDTREKETALTAKLGNARVSIGAMAKGSGMIHPNMATMLAFITTDIAISKTLLKQALKDAVSNTFNRIAIDNDMSTNDCVFVLANAQAGNKPISKKGREFDFFKQGLNEVCKILAYEMVEDGEGVEHVCTLQVSGAKNDEQAERCARHIANSMLFKTMLAGADANWGRIVACIGSSGVKFDYDAIQIDFDGITVLNKGNVKVLNLPKARKVLQRHQYPIHVKIGKGAGRATFITTDLTKKYVEINSEYC